eukprot:IDg4300t1
MEELHPQIESSLSKNRQRSRQVAERGTPANFVQGDFVLVARDDFHKDEKLCLRWRGPRRIIRAVSEWVYIVEDLRNGELTEVHSTRLKFYSDSSLDEKAILSHVLVLWRGLSHREDTEEPLKNVHEDVPVLLSKLLARKTTPKDIADRVKQELGLRNGG